MAKAHVVADAGRSRQSDALQYHMLSGVATPQLLCVTVVKY